MITLREIRNRIENKNSYLGYDGFDMSGCRDDGGIEYCNKRNFKFLKRKFNDVFWDLELENFKLWTWKGSVWWGDPDFSKIEYDFTSDTTENIILFLAKNKPYPKKDVNRIITKEMRYKVLKRQKWKCNECGAPLKFSKNSKWEGEVAHIDHIYPFSKRGTYPNGYENINELSNLQALCPSCNLKKREKIN